MHDPMCVAWDVPFPFPRRWKYDDARPGEPRWTLGRMRRTNPDNLGEPVYAWFRPAGYRPRVAGRAYRARTLCTIWHVEPNDRDSGSVCKHWADGKPVKAWRWHVWHWRIQVPVLQGFRARLFDRCEMCGRKGRPNHSFQWDSRPLGWRKWRSRTGLYHRECADLHMMRRNVEVDRRIIEALFAAYRVTTDESAAELLDRLTRNPGAALEWSEGYRLQNMLGFERDDNYRLVPKS